MNDTYVMELWKFVRADMPTDQFEPWLYRQDDLEQTVGKNLYLDLISTNYTNPKEVFYVREKLKSFLRPSLKCECPTLADFVVVPMGMDGLDKRFFATVDKLIDYGRDRWWLYCAHCHACGQHWMIAQEERIYDDHFLRRLTREEVKNIIDRDEWPTEFATYERLLDLGGRLSKPCRFVDPLSASLIDTARDLVASRPNMSAERLAVLLGVDTDQARAILAAR